MIAGLQVGLSVELHILQIIASGITSAEKSFTSQDTTTRRRRRRRRRRRTFMMDLYRSGSLFRCKKLSVINGSPEHSNALKLGYTYALHWY